MAGLCIEDWQETDQERRDAMTQTAFITNGDQPFNQMIARHLLAATKGLVTLQFAEREAAEVYTGTLTEESRERCMIVLSSSDDPREVQQTIDQSVERMGRLHLFIHGHEWEDEEEQLATDPDEFGESIARRFRTMFLYSRSAGAYMARKKEGSILFPLLCDTLYYSGYPSSPVTNHGKISFMKSLAKELAPFRVRVNAITFGYYANREDETVWKDQKKMLDIYALKPYVSDLEEMIPSLDLLLQTHQSKVMISGQNLHIGAGVDTIL